MPVSTAAASGQLSFADLPEDDQFAATALFDLPLVVVDLETTGGSAENDRITEIGAVKIRGGRVEGEFATLVDPERDIPPQIVALTGITTAMTYDAPPIDEVLPSFFEFARGAILVAHNARFDTGFLRRGYEQLGLAWPRPTVIDTVAVDELQISFGDNDRLAARNTAPRGAIA